MKKNIAVLTAARAEYGLLSPVIKKLMLNREINVNIVVTGMHLSPEFGLTFKEIEKDGIKIDKKIEILLSSDTPVSVSKSMGLALISFSEYFEESKPDALLVLGDRYETLAVCCAAMNERIPIIHLHGGETTEGAVDEAIRHCITKMSYLHFTSTEEYRKRVIQLGEDPNRVFHVGALGVENVLNCPLLSRKDLEDSIGVDLDRPYSIVTYHPVTLEGESMTGHMKELCDALDERPDMLYIVTKSNADAGGRAVNQMWDEYAADRNNVFVFESLGMVRYLSAVKYSAFVIGNSSSGLIEVPSFKKPTINIGDRQKGRIKALSVIDCKADKRSITNAIDYALSRECSGICSNVANPYEGNQTSDRIVSLIMSKVLLENVDLKKRFYDIPCWGGH